MANNQHLLKSINSGAEETDFEDTYNKLFRGKTYTPCETELPKDWTQNLMKECANEEVSTLVTDLTILLTEKFILDAYKQIAGSKNSKQLENLKYEDVYKFHHSKPMFFAFQEFFQPKLSTYDVQVNAQRILAHNRNIKAKPLYADQATNYTLFLYMHRDNSSNPYKNGSLTGIPLVFIPGNSAPFLIARFIGFTLTNQIIKQHKPFHFDVFTVNFNEEVNVLGSKVLLREVNFLTKAINHIETLYDADHIRKQKFVIMGHSMGGIVGRMVMESPSMQNMTSMLITLGTPHRRSPIILNREVISAWKSLKKNTDIPIISIYGGLLDLDVDESITRDDGILSYSVNGMDRCWRRTDHQGITWCYQLQM
uniref:GPI inositol-deacylase n=1 Tax=Rhabditophanes sp. KR3021 TaxID=114890 RepID=A0AC35UAZ3_9BILA